MKTRLLLFLFLPMFCMAQKQHYIWYFGNGAGLDFNHECTPTVLTNGHIAGFEGCATIADKTTGQLLFYTNSDSVWNKNHVVMPNGHLVTNGNTISQVLIIQKPSSNSVYYIITAEIQCFGGQGLKFHEVDMSLNGGLGGLTFKDSLLFPSVTEKITAVRHSNGTDIWLIVHECSSDRFLSFLVTPSGINMTPVISQTGKVYPPISYDAIGEMKASPDGSKLAVVTLLHPDIELFDFNQTTGQISNPITLPETGGYDPISGSASGLYGLSFSSSSAMLYVSKQRIASFPGQLIQYNITSNDSATINNSRVNVYTTASKGFYSIQLAPDRKIYVAQNVDDDYLSVINSPDSAGLTCNYQDNGLYLNGKTGSWGLNNLMEYGYYCNNIKDTIIDTITGMNDVSKNIKNIQSFPNPFSLQTTLHPGKPLNNATLTLYSLIGTRVRQVRNICGESVIINREQLPTGLYYYQLVQDRQIYTGKLVITDD